MKPCEYGHLQVSYNKRYLMNGSKPFFWLGDTAWLLFEKLSESEIKAYLKNRKHKHFNVIQATLVHSSPAVSSLEILIDRDFAKPNAGGRYWAKVDQVVAMTEQLGIYMALLPSWGSWAKRGVLNLANVEAYGSFLAERYGTCKNVIWLLGGDIRGDAAYDLYLKFGELLKARCLIS